MIFDLVYNILSVAISTSILSFLNDKIEKNASKREKDEIMDKITAVVGEKGNEDVISMMLTNVAELREYYVISKNQARSTFSAALIVCFLGIVLYGIGIMATVFLDKDVSIVTVISGTIVEVIAGTFFWLYTQSTKQLSIYHQRLRATEKYLTAMQLVEKVPEDKKYDEYQYIIRAMINDNVEMTKNK